MEGFGFTLSSLGILSFFLLASVSSVPVPNSEGFWSEPAFFRSLSDYLTEEDPNYGRGRVRPSVIRGIEVQQIQPSVQGNFQSLVDVTPEWGNSEGRSPQIVRNLVPSQVASYIAPPPGKVVSSSVVIRNPNSIPYQMEKGRKQYARIPSMPQGGRIVEVIRSTTVPVPVSSSTTPASVWVSSTAPSVTVSSTPGVRGRPAGSYNPNQAVHGRQAHQSSSNVGVRVPAPKQHRNFLRPNILIATPSPITATVDMRPQQQEVQGSDHRPIVYRGGKQIIASNSVDEGTTSSLSDATNFLGKLNNYLETGRKILYFPKGVMDVMNTAVTYAGENPYVQTALGMMADSVFGSTETKPLVVAPPSPASAAMSLLNSFNQLNQVQSAIGKGKGIQIQQQKQQAPPPTTPSLTTLLTQLSQLSFGISQGLSGGKLV